jgi:hypothetical protein
LLSVTDTSVIGFSSAGVNGSLSLGKLQPEQAVQATSPMRSAIAESALEQNRKGGKEEVGEKCEDEDVRLRR